MKRIIILTVLLIAATCFSGEPVKIETGPLFVQSGSTLFFDGDVGIGRTPTERLDVYESANAQTGVLVTNDNAGSSAGAFVNVVSDGAACSIFTFSNAFSVAKLAGNGGIGVLDGSDLYCLNANFGAGKGDIYISDLTGDYVKIKCSDDSGDTTLYGNQVEFSPGTTGGIIYAFSEAIATLSGATTDIEINVPTGSKLIACQLRVDTAITSDDGAVSWDAAYSGGATQVICTGQAFTKSTKVSTWFDVNTDTDIASGEVDITITPNANTFSGGVVRAICYYHTLDSLADAP